MQKIKIALSLCIFSLIFAGCSLQEKEIESNTVVIQKDGSISDVIIEDFDQSVYDLAELESMAKEEIALYQETAGENKITIDTMEVVENKLHLKMDFASYEDYAAYNSKTFFVGTLADAYAAGYSLDITMVSEKNSDEVLVNDDLMQMGLSNVVISDYTGIIRCPSKVLYYSEGAVLVDKTQVAGLTDDLTYVIYK
jgi:hypothetical protein